AFPLSLANILPHKMYTVRAAFAKLSQVTHANYRTKPDISKLLALSRSFTGRQGPFFSKYRLVPLTSTLYNEYGLLGDGTFSVVFRCINRDAGDEYAGQDYRPTSMR